MGDQNVYDLHFTKAKLEVEAMQMDMEADADIKQAAADVLGLTQASLSPLFFEHCMYRQSSYTRRHC